MTFGRPLFTLGTLILMAIILATSIWLVILLFMVTFSFLALWGFRATLTLIAEAEARRNQSAEKASQTDASPAKGRGGQVRPRE
jgi:fatty acid desaturase